MNDDNSKESSDISQSPQENLIKGVNLNDELPVVKPSQQLNNSVLGKLKQDRDSEPEK